MFSDEGAKKKGKEADEKRDSHRPSRSSPILPLQTPPASPNISVPGVPGSWDSESEEERLRWPL